MSSYKMEAKRKGICDSCKQVVEMGAEITYIPPKGHRKRSLIFHRSCAKAHGDNLYPTNPNAWHKNAEWMSREDFAMLREAMAKRVVF